MERDKLTFLNKEISKYLKKLLKNENSLDISKYCDKIIKIIKEEPRTKKVFQLKNNMISIIEIFEKTLNILAILSLIKLVNNVIVNLIVVY